MDRSSDGAGAAAGRRPIVLASFGSLGDLHPYMATALHLQRRGHRVALATSPLHRGRVESAGLEFRPVRPDAPEDPDLFVKLLDARRGPEYVFRDLLMGSLRASFGDLRAATLDADLLVSGPTAVAAPLVAETTGIRWISTVLQPLLFFSAYDPPVPPQWPALVRAARRGPRWARLLRGLARVSTHSWTAPYRRLRVELGLPPGRDPLFGGQHAPRLVLAMFSRVLGERQPDWPGQVRQTGFAFFDAADGGRAAPPELHAFLASGPPPIVFTLGSTAVMAPGTFYRESVEAARRLGRRAVLLVGSAENGSALAAHRSESVAVFDYAPYRDVFPHAAAIVHQGGVGTLAQALRAGRPQVIVPFAHDQPDNAARAERLGVARVVRRTRYDAHTAGSALAGLLADRVAGARALEAARQINAESGVESACAAIEAALVAAPAAPDA